MRRLVGWRFAVRGFARSWRRLYTHLEGLVRMRNVSGLVSLRILSRSSWFRVDHDRAGRHRRSPPTGRMAYRPHRRPPADRASRIRRPSTSPTAPRPSPWPTFATSSTSPTGSRTTTRRCRMSSSTAVRPTCAAAACATCPTAKGVPRMRRLPAFRIPTSSSNWPTSSTICVPAPTRGRRTRRR